MLDPLLVFPLFINYPLASLGLKLAVLETQAKRTKINLYKENDMDRGDGNHVKCVTDMVKWLLNYEKNLLSPLCHTYIRRMILIGVMGIRWSASKTWWNDSWIMRKICYPLFVTLPFPSPIYMIFGKLNPLLPGGIYGTVIKETQNTMLKI